MIKFVTWLMTLLRFERHDISRKGLPEYLTRWVVWPLFPGPDGTRRYADGCKVFLHLFHRGDAEDYPHDHPWPFWSLILWGGYYEHTATGKHWHGPGSLLRRPAEWQHRVELHGKRKCVTLIWTGKKQRTWGFVCPDKGWINWRDHQANQDAGGSGCE